MNNMIQPKLGAGDIASSPFETCPNCGCKVFREALVMKRISKLLTATPNDTLYPIPVYVCDKCGDIAPSIKESEDFKRLAGDFDNNLINKEK